MYVNEMLHESECPPARVVVTGDQPIMRAGVRRLVEGDCCIKVVRECANRPEAVAEAITVGADLVLMDIDLSTHPGALERMEALLRAANGIPVLLLTATIDCDAMHHALRHGAIGLVLKQRSPEALPRAIVAAVAGEMCLEQSAMASLFRGEQRHGDNDHVKLTAREREIMDLVALGLHNKAIAGRLCISDTTVRHHLTSIFEKLAVTNRLELMHYMLTSAAGAREPVAAWR